MMGRGRKALNGLGSPDKQEDKMNIISRFEAASHSTAELYALHTQALRDFALAARGSNARRKALATLDIVEAELAMRPDVP